VTPPSQTAKDAALLLGHEVERLQAVDIDGPDGQHSKVIVCALDQLVFDAAPLGTDWTTDANGDPYTSLYLFAEDVVLGGALRLNGGVVAVHRLVADGAAALQAPGAPGLPGRSDVSGTDPKKATPAQHGGNGGRGGDLVLYLEDPDPRAPPPRIAASGGRGGTGGAGDVERVGGDGGDGGDGGAVVVLTTHAAMHWLDALRTAYGHATDSAKTAAGASVGQLLPDAPPYAETRAELLALADSGAHDIEGVFEAAAAALQSAAIDWRDQLTATVYVLGGAYGGYGDGMRGVDNNQPFGASNGAVGAPGVAEIHLVAALNAPRKDITPILAAHPSQCRMVLEKAKLQYLFLQPTKNVDTQSDVGSLVRTLDRLVTRTAIFAGLDPDDDLAQLYAEHENEIGAIDAISALTAVHDEAVGLLNNLHLGLDVFGMPADHVPLTSLRFLAEKGMDPIFSAFSDIETAYNTQLKKLDKTVDVVGQVKIARDQISGMQDTIMLDIPQLEARLSMTARTIDGWQVLLPAKLSRLNAALDSFAADLKGYFNCDITTVLAGLGQVAFAPESSAMWLTQGAQFVNSSISTVTDASGATVQKQYLLKQIKTVEATIDGLSEGFQSATDGTLQLSDPGGAKLLAEEDKIKALIDELSTKIPSAAKELGDAMDDYVDAVTSRNSQVLAYNASITLLVQEAQNAANLKQRTGALDDQSLALVESDAPDLTAFTAQAYYGARKQVIQYISMIAKAYRFWALEDRDLLREGLGSDPPPQIDKTLLSKVKGDVWSAYSAAIGVQNPHSFPADPTTQQGEIVRVTGFQLDTFKKTNLLMLSIPPATADTPQGAPFYNMSCVRVTQVRVYLPGVKVAPRADGQPARVEMTITQHGHETIVNASGDWFRFSHEPCSAPWSYEPANGDTIYQHANFQVELANDLIGGGDRALIGPFADWTITLDNPDFVDLSAVDRIDISFLGNSGPPFR
jgi:hypothetical protein